MLANRKEPESAPFWYQSLNFTRMAASYIHWIEFGLHGDKNLPTGYCQ